ncbi:hypothetical protein HPP92_012921 [Vanilla planifolia]|uniref:RNA methyltransferase n=1 Tax=Vanilla planifolia TaxID=51239 RepID=A0A835UXI0_VANPL|nr:hypothetical protein HPP92_012921 [Vanilla planifolia]
MVKREGVLGFSGGNLASVVVGAPAGVCSADEIEGGIGATRGRNRVAGGSKFPKKIRKKGEDRKGSLAAAGASEESSDPYLASSRFIPMILEETKGMAEEKQEKQSTKVRKRKEIFVYGNYRKYYGYRLNHNVEKDPRLDVLKKEWFENKECLDIGCNQGLVTIGIARRFRCRSIIGIDIDKGLIEDAKCNLRNTSRRRQSPGFLVKTTASNGLVTKEFPECKVSHISNEDSFCEPSSSSPMEQDLLQRVVFRCENFVEKMLPCLEKYDTILCLSVTKWIHLNWGDDGLVTLFVKIWRLLKAGGILVLEPQPWSSYKRNRLVSETTKRNFSSIDIHPRLFREILLDKVGFRSADTITNGLPGTAAGFDRPIIVFQK